jgi:hypothetical protein
MALHHVDAPKTAHRAVHARLGHPAVAAALQAPTRRPISPAALALSTPHRVALLALDRIAAQTTLRRAARLRGWRFLVHRGDRVIAAAGVLPDGRAKHRFGHLTEGPFAAGTETAIRRAETHGALRRGRFEPVLLMVPAVHAVALWLRDLDGDGDRVMVIPPAPHGLTPYRLVTARAFMARLVRLSAGIPRGRHGRSG